MIFACRMQEEREERHRLKAALKEAAKSGQISLPEVIETVVPTPKKGEEINFIL